MENNASVQAMPELTTTQQTIAALCGETLQMAYTPILPDNFFNSVATLCR